MNGWARLAEFGFFLAKVWCIEVFSRELHIQNANASADTFLHKLSRAKSIHMDHGEEYNLHMFSPHQKLMPPSGDKR